MRVIPPKRKLSFLDLALVAPPDEAEALERSVRDWMAAGLTRTGAERKAVEGWKREVR